MANESGFVRVEKLGGIGRVTFGHPKSNSLPSSVLRDLAAQIVAMGADRAVKVIVLASDGEGAFCAGASFDELKQISNAAEGEEFFMGFARVILALRSCPQLVIARVQGKAVGGGVGLIAAADYAIAVSSASVKLSELAVGIGPFVIGPAVQRKIGLGAFGALAIDTEWRDAAWARAHGLYAMTVESVKELDTAVDQLAGALMGRSSAAMERLKGVLWEGTDGWDKLLKERAAASGSLIVGAFGA